MPKNTAKSHLTPTTATQFMAVGAGGFFAKVLGSALATMVGDALNVDSGVWTPSYSGESNITAASEVHRRGSYQRHGDEIHFTLKVQVTLSGAGPTRAFDFTLPVDPGANFADTHGGSAACSTGITTSSAVRANSTSGAKTMTCTFSDATGGATPVVYLSGSYSMQV
jgi:hypothetical protein